MIVQFPDYDTLQLAVTMGEVPTAISLAPAVAGIDDGMPWVEFDAAAPRGMQAALKRLGAKPLKGAPGLGEMVHNWLQALPVRRDPAPPQLASSAPVLFEVPEANQLPGLVGEMLRLGNDRQSYRWLAGDGGGAVLLRVIGPPYYSLLRALEPPEDPEAPKISAFVERAPRVWVEVGQTHPLVEQIKPPEGQMVLLRPPRRWDFLDDVPFHDIYEILEFVLPEGRTDWQDAELEQKLTVPLRLVPGSAGEPAQLWVLRDDAVNQFDNFVRNAEEKLLGRLAFAVGDSDGQTIIVLRVRPSKQAPPEVVLRAKKFRPFLKLPNLFVPVGTSLQPSLRRDAVRKLLADDPGQVVWLFPDDDAADGGFTPESLPDDAFRPLEDWVDYVLDHDRAALTGWIQSAQFDFESFVCRDDQPATPKGPGGKGRSRKGGGAGPEAEGEIVEDVSQFTAPPTAAAPPADDYAEIAATPPNELQALRTALEDRFLRYEGPLDAPERLALWPELARLNAALGQTDDAALCWLSSLWEDDQPSAEHLVGWLRTELKLQGPPRELTAAELDRFLAKASPSPGELRALVAAVVWAARQKPAPKALVQKLPAVQRYLEAHERFLGVRAVWLAWASLARLSGADVLALARVRDRLLDRLLTEGLNPERDLPAFLRFAGQRDSERMRLVRDRVAKLHAAALKWGGSEQVNAPYFHLTFAFGQARLGEATAARDLLAEGEKALRGLKAPAAYDDVHKFLLAAFRYRTEQALAGKSHAGPLPPEQADYLEKLKADSKSGPTNDPKKLYFYIIDRFRQQSQIVEPHEKLDPYRDWKKHSDDLHKELALLPDIKDKTKLADRIRQLVKGGAKGKQAAETRLYVLAEALPLAPRVGEQFTLELLQQVVPALEESARSQEPLLYEKQGQLLERALFLAAHYDRAELVQTLVDRFLKVLQGRTGKTLYEAINLVAGECLRSLRKLGLRDEIHKLLQSMHQLVIQGQDLETFQKKHAADWPEALRTLLHLAAGWLYFGQVERAMPMLDAARELLLTKDPGIPREKQWHQEYTKVARTYATALGQAPAELALNRIHELLSRMAKVNNTFTTGTHYSRLHLNVVEDVVLAIVSDDFAHGPAMRRWLDDDEYLVRRRIHRDLRAAMSQHGL